MLGIIAASVCALSVSAYAQTPPTPGAPKRFPQITLEQIAPEGQQLAKEIIQISSVGLGGPYNIMFRSPVYADRLKKLLDYLRFNTSLPTRLNEFAILIQGYEWKSQVEWYAHYPLALKAGLPQSVADDLKAGIRPRNMAADEEVVYDVSTTLMKQHEISDELFYKAKKILGEQQLVDLVAVSGTYVSVAMLLALGQEMSPDNKPLPFPPQSSTSIKVVSSGGFAPAYKTLAPKFEWLTSNKLVSEWGPSMGTTTNAIPVRMARGENIDVVIMVGPSLDELMQQGKLLPGSKVVLANSPIACAVAHGAPHPDISTVDKLKQTFLNAKTVAFSDSASGEYIKNELMDKLGIKAQMQGKARQIPATPVGEIVAKGEAEFGCQQRSELKAVQGIDIIGLLPKEVQLITPFSAAVVANSKAPNESKAFLKYLSSPENADVIEQTGLEPVNIKK
jgi:ABC-type molybdate transport system substrate-binding protein